MSEPITITAQVAVWLHNTTYGGNPESLLRAIEQGDSIEAVNMLSFYGPSSKESFSDCIRVGEADVTLRLIPRDEQTRLALASLEAKLQQLRAAYQQRQQEILTEISKLQALTNEVTNEVQED